MAKDKADKMLEEKCSEIEKEIRSKIIKETASSVYFMVIMILIEDFKFSVKEAAKFCSIYNTQLECLNDDFVKIEDFRQWCIERRIDLEVIE
jgi:hypothetical protein